jgi:hypothetical protein
MPCTDYREELPLTMKNIKDIAIKNITILAVEADIYKTKTDHVTDMLCQILTILEAGKFVDGTGLISRLPFDIQEWWKNHKMFDQKRK